MCVRGVVICSRFTDADESAVDAAGLREKWRERRASWGEDRSGVWRFREFAV